jgi:hypothetical protein
MPDSSRSREAAVGREDSLAVAAVGRELIIGDLAKN